MPTGYTAKLMDEGQSFPEFAMDCARAFGARITLRDSDPNKPIPEAFKPSQWNAKQLEKAKVELENLEAMSGEQRNAFCREQRQKAVEAARRWFQEERAENARIDAVLVGVEAWTPPTGEHAEFKKFMLNQLDISRNNTDYVEKELAKAKAKNAKEYYADVVARAKRSIKYHEREQAKEDERVAGRNEWVRKLRESLMCPA